MSDPGPHSQPDETMVDLLIKQLIEGLSPAEQQALDQLDSAASRGLSRELERATAAIVLAATGPHSETLPSALRAQIEQQARAFFADSKVVELKTAGETAPARTLRASRGGTFGWFAAAACFLLAVFGWLRPMQPPIAQLTAQVQQTAPSPLVPPAVTIPAEPTLAQERAALLERPESTKVSLGATKDPAAAGVTGDAVWDPVAQRGFLHFVGLPVNDPNVRQYQIWIFDGARDKRYPVDGGVFDVPANSTEVIVPIRAALLVHAAKAFAVTVEKPGGVVVSALHHVVVLGAAG